MELWLSRELDSLPRFPRSLQPLFWPSQASKVPLRHIKIMRTYLSTYLVKYLNRHPRDVMSLMSQTETTACESDSASGNSRLSSISLCILQATKCFLGRPLWKARELVTETRTLYQTKSVQTFCSLLIELPIIRSTVHVHEHYFMQTTNIVVISASNSP